MRELPKREFFPARLDAAEVERSLRAAVAQHSGAGEEFGLTENTEQCADNTCISSQEDTFPEGTNQDSDQRDMDLNQLRSALEEAERQASVGAHHLEVTRFWAPLRPLARSVLFLTRTITNLQRHVNRALLESASRLTETIHRLTTDVAYVQECQAQQADSVHQGINGLTRKLQRLGKQFRSQARQAESVHQGHTRDLQQFWEQFRGQGQQAQSTQEALGSVTRELSHLGEKLRGQAQQAEVVDEVLGSHTRELEYFDEQFRSQALQVEERFGCQAQQTEAIQEGVRSLTNELQRLWEQFSSQARQTEDVQENIARLTRELHHFGEQFNSQTQQAEDGQKRVASLAQELQRLAERFWRADVSHAQQALRHESLEARLGRVEESLSQGQLRHGSNHCSGNGVPAETSVLSAGTKADNEKLYLDLENRFRGSRALIRERLQVYLPLVREANLGTQDMPLVDIGSGRGEWLELAREQGWLAWGLDSNHLLAEECRRRGSLVTEGQALEYLISLPAACLGGITAFHVIEHFRPDSLSRFLEESTRVLKPGGLLILETPNPENLVAGASNFAKDPTHQRPLHPEFLLFLAEKNDLDDVKILRLREHRIRDALPLLPADNPVAAYVNPLIEEANVRFFGAPDYALIARKKT